MKADQTSCALHRKPGALPQAIDTELGAGAQTESVPKEA